MEGWHTGAEWVDSGALVKRINFVADRVADLSLPGVRDMVERVRSLGTVSPERLVDTCLDLIGPVEVEVDTHAQLVAQAHKDGEVRWDTPEDQDRSATRVGEVFSLIAACREYQMG